MATTPITVINPDAGETTDLFAGGGYLGVPLTGAPASSGYEGVTATLSDVGSDLLADAGVTSADLVGLIPAAGPNATSNFGGATVTPAPASTGVSPWLWIVLIGAGLLFLDSTTGKR